MLSWCDVSLIIFHNTYESILTNYNPILIMFNNGKFCEESTNACKFLFTSKYFNDHLTWQRKYIFEIISNACENKLQELIS